jgi:dipeptidyl aminopeptidase/acylaminoacyl peptidase
MKTICLTLLALVFFVNLNAQEKSKKLIDHTVFDGWKSIKSQKISDDGKWITYEIIPGKGDGKLFLYEVSTGKLDSFERGSEAKFFDNGNSFAYKLKPKYELTRKAKLDKKKAEEQPKDSLIIFNLTSKTTIKYANVKSFDVTYESYLWAWQKDKIKETPKVLSKKEKRKAKKKKPAEIKADGTDLYIISTFQGKRDSKKFFGDPTSPIEQKISHVSEYKLSKEGNLLSAVVQRKVNKVDSAYIYVAFKGENSLAKKIFTFQGTIKSVNMDENGEQITFLASSDTAKVKVYDLYYWKKDYSSPSLVIDRNNSAMKKGWSVSENKTPFFSENGKRIFFGTNVQPINEPKDTLLDDEKYKLDLWSYTDPRLQTQQLKDLDSDKKKTFLAVYHISDNKMIQLCDSLVDEYRLVQKGDANILLGISSFPYLVSTSWESPWSSDYYTINLTTGEKTKRLEKHPFAASLSNTGKYLVWYQRKVDDWFAMNVETGEKWAITNGVKDNFFEDDNGVPAEEDAFSIAGWSENDDFVYIHSKYDIWKISPEKLTQECITSKTNNLEKKFGKKYTYIKTDIEEKFLNEKMMLFHTFNDDSKQAGFATLKRNSSEDLPTQVTEDNKKFNFIQKAKNADVQIFSRMSFTEYPDLFYTKLNDFPKASKISKTNPQQSQYNWGTAELVNWTTPKGRELKGILYKPENFNKDSLYPLLVYYYELYSDDIHSHYTPKPSASIINPSEYASNGYVVFFPDILYNEGEPGEGAMDCIISGTEYILSLGFCNKNRIGIQGQSWGGYQTAYLITQTKMFTAAMAGAPVSNMTSAYGGIRWGSGLTRMFQYEHGQSRLGKTLWEDRERYIKNSPLFFADKVETPLLMMHNDQDGAVPWYQGIEYFNALRRLNKPVWMLNYNGDDHNLTKWPNKVDLSIRMRSFFDYYLLDKPMPKWMSEGIPAIEKGKVNKYEVIEKK